MKKLLSLFIIFTIAISSITVFAAEVTAETAKPAIVFSDVDVNSTSGKDILKLVNAGILNGYTDGTFRPNNPLTRAELCKIVNIAFKYTEAAEETFSDVKADDWFYSQVAIAKKAGYIAGHADGTFKGNDYLTREQACTIVTRVTQLFDLSMTETITDAVSEWAVPYVNKVVANRLMPLEEGGKFRATENITRAELVSVVANFVVDAPTVDEMTTYSVTVKNTKGEIKNATVEIKDGKIIVTLPKTYTLTSSNQTTVTVLNKDSKPVFGITVTVKDANSEKTATTNVNGQITVPVKATSAGGGGMGGGSGNGNNTTTPSGPDQDTVKTQVNSLNTQIGNLIGGENPKIDPDGNVGSFFEKVQDTLDKISKDDKITDTDHISNTYGKEISDAYNGLSSNNCQERTFRT